MILNDLEIRRRCQTENLVVPYAKENIQPASIDLRLGNEFVTFTTHSSPLDVARRQEDLIEDTRSYTIKSEFINLNPSTFMLGVTAETVSMPDDLVGRVEGKSSLGRLGLAVHVTAGFIDPGFSGPITLEFVNMSQRPFTLTAGMLICQLSFHVMSAPADKPYVGRYQNATGVEASKYGNPIAKEKSDASSHLL